MSESPEKTISFLTSSALTTLLAASLASCGVGLASPLAGQETEGPLSPAGRLRAEVAPVFQTWHARFGLDGGREPLGRHLADATGAALFPGIGALERSLQDLLTDPGYRARLGASAAEVSASRTRVPVRIDLGVRDWLTVGFTVPLVKNRTEVAFSFRADTVTANLGLSPAVTHTSEVLAFTEELFGRFQAASARADEICAGAPGSPECAQARQVERHGERLAEGFLSGYRASPLFALEDSPAAEALRQQVAAFNEGLQALGVALLSRQPLFAPARLGREAFDQLFLDPAVGLQAAPLADRVGLWELGDVELHAAVRLLEGTSPAEPGTAPGLAYQIGAGALVRLGTGRLADPDSFLDLPAGDGQTDLEGRIFSNLRAGRFGLWSDLRYGIQGPATIDRRGGPPELILLPVVNRATFEWTPGNYLQLDLVPRYHFTDELAFTAVYRLFRKGEDRFVPLSAPPDTTGLFPAQPFFGPADRFLSEGTDERLHELGGGLVYSTLEAWRAGRARLPFEARWTFRWAASGAGRDVPAGVRTTVGLRLYRRFWGR